MKTLIAAVLLSVIQLFIVWWALSVLMPVFGLTPFTLLQTFGLCILVRSLASISAKRS